MFHVGHLNILKKAKEQCEYLIVGVSTDELVQSYKHKAPIIPLRDRMEIVSAIKYVDKVVVQETMNKFKAWEELHYDVMFHGDDWKNTQMYNDTEAKLQQVKVDVVYIPHTPGISSTILQGMLNSVNQGGKLGYTQGTFDMFHIGHLNLIMNAKAHCDRLIVGVNSDALVKEYKSKTPVINQYERLEIIKALKYVDDAYIAETLDKSVAHKKDKFSVIFIGDDWKGNQRWKATEDEMQKEDVSVVYLKHTDGISSSILKTYLQKA